MLIERDRQNSHTSFIYDMWGETYLKDRRPLPMTHNPSIVWVLHQNKGLNFKSPFTGIFFYIKILTFFTPKVLLFYTKNITFSTPTILFFTPKILFFKPFSNFFTPTFLDLFTKNWCKKLV